MTGAMVKALQVREVLEVSYNQNWNTSSGSFLVRPQIIVVPLPGGSNMPRAESREQSALGVDGKRAPGL